MTTLTQPVARRRMTVRALASSLCLIAATTSIASGQASTPPNATDPNAADREMLREIKALYEQAAREGKPELLQPYLAPGFSGVMVTAEEVTSFDQLDAYWKKIRGLIGEGGSYTVELIVDQPAIFDGNIAYSSGRTKDRVVTASGQIYDFEGRWTAMFVRARDAWNVIRVHGSIDPIGNPFVIAAMKPALATGAVAGGAAGLILGAGVGFLIGRRRRAIKA